MKNYEFHEIANIFPLIEGKEFQDLVDDIKKNGLMDDIWLHDGKIIDGRNRYRACLEAGVEPRFRIWNGTGSMISFVISLNLRRRHLDSGQRAIAAVKAMPFFEEEAKKNKKATEGRPKKDEKPSQKIDGVSEEEDANSKRAEQMAADAFRTNRQYVHEAKEILAETPEAIEEIMSNKVSFASVVKEKKKRKRKEKIQTQKEEIKKIVPPTGKFNVIVCDPPWKFGGEYDPKGRRSTGDYPTMSMEEIKKIKLPADKDCVLWLWGVDIYLKETLEVIEAWGFERKATLIWVKNQMGLGSWLRNQHEYCFVAVKGKPVFHGSDISTILNAPRGKHSEKPDAFYKLVEKCCPYKARIDYFARKSREGWEVYGNDIDEKS